MNSHSVPEDLNHWKAATGKQVPEERDMQFQRRNIGVGRAADLP